MKNLNEIRKTSISLTTPLSRFLDSGKYNCDSQSNIRDHTLPLDLNFNF